MKQIVILGSTGTIGQNTLDVIKHNLNSYQILALSCYNNIQLLAQQIQQFHPEIVSVGKGLAEALKKLLPAAFQKINILEGEEGNLKIACLEKADCIVAAMVGSAGLLPVMAAIKAGKTIALANKEPMVLAGKLIMEAVQKYHASILPIDSEHNAIFQSLAGIKMEAIDHITLTASGGPFLRTPLHEFQNITLNDALQHPNWEMGQKITIDSATGMNKCLEIIEARWLFNLTPAKIRIMIHPESIIHSMITCCDGSTIAQLSRPDMKVPIAYCLGYPDRIYSGTQILDLTTISELHFEKPDEIRFPTFLMPYKALELGEGVPAALNGANEVLVAMFLKEEISFIDIFTYLEKMMAKLQKTPQNQLQQFLLEIKEIKDALQADQWGRNYIFNSIDEKKLLRRM